MIVITVIGLASAVAVLSLPDRRGRVTDEALKFAARVRAAHDVAVVEASPVSIWVTRGGYGFDRRADGAWSPMTAKPCASRNGRTAPRRRFPTQAAGCGSPST
ncbi:hypothetical protein GCM10020258_28520 [Sphingomonas yabuuchiae]